MVRLLCVVHFVTFCPLLLKFYPVNFMWDEMPHDPAQSIFELNLQLFAPHKVRTRLVHLSVVWSLRSTMEALGVTISIVIFFLKIVPLRGTIFKKLGGNPSGAFSRTFCRMHWCSQHVSFVRFFCCVLSRALCSRFNFNRTN